MPKKYFIKGKEEITDANAPVISDEFIDRQPEGDYQGQTIEVQSDTKLEEDQGTGEVAILRTFRFTKNQEIFNVREPSAQEIFESHKQGILGLLWQDGLTPDMNLEVKFIPDREFYFIQIWAKPQAGQVLIEKTKTLTEIINEARPNTDKVHGSLPVPTATKKKASRTAKTPK